MANIFYLHYHEAELAGRVAALAAAGHAVRWHWSTEAAPKLGDELPDVVVISLDRLPSHGRHVAQWVWEAKKRRQIPIVFAGGKPDKVEEAREQFPAALFCAADEVAEVIANTRKAGGL